MPADWISDAESICRSVCPELSAVYIVLRAELNSSFDQCGRCLGYTSPFLDVQLEPFLERDGRWAGRGFATVIYEDAILAAWRARRPGFDVDWLLTTVVLHELAHHTERGRSWRHKLAVELAERPLKDWANTGPPKLSREFLSFDADLPPWHNHGAEFIRSAIHVVHRAWTLCGFPIHSQQIDAAGELYGLASIGDYAHALGDEPARLADRPLLEVLASDPPEAFSIFAAADLAAAEAEWERRSPT
ncbi:MAG TPA: hypothetical protein VML55_00340 [Planctomycetaceae bacterium]|nr:hypothetical protein [Planctomycetaceae bacterium]